MSTIEIGKRLVALCKDGKALQAVDALYDEKIVSIEAEGSDELPAHMEGIEAIRGKNNWWYDNHDVHASNATGPFCGQSSEQFAVFFETEVTFKPTGERQKLNEVALYTVSNDKIVREDFSSLID
jgi:hypothetical protein